MVNIMVINYSPSQKRAITIKKNLIKESNLDYEDQETLNEYIKVLTKNKDFDIHTFNTKLNHRLENIIKNNLDSKKKHQNSDRITMEDLVKSGNHRYFFIKNNLLDSAYENEIKSISNKEILNINEQIYELKKENLKYKEIIEDLHNNNDSRIIINQIKLLKNENQKLKDNSNQNKEYLEEDLKFKILINLSQEGYENPELFIAQYENIIEKVETELLEKGDLCLDYEETIKSLDDKIEHLKLENEELIEEYKELEDEISENYSEDKDLDEIILNLNSKYEKTIEKYESIINEDLMKKSLKELNDELEKYKKENEILKIKNSNFNKIKKEKTELQNKHVDLKLENTQLKVSNKKLIKENKNLNLLNHKFEEENKLNKKNLDLSNTKINNQDVIIEKHRIDNKNLQKEIIDKNSLILKLKDENNNLLQVELQKEKSKTFHQKLNLSKNNNDKFKKDKNCTNCGKIVPEDSIFCIHCGVKLKKQK